MTGGVLQRAATTTPPTAPAGPPDEAAVWVRHPADLARLLAAAGAFVAVMALTYGDPQAARGISLDLVQIVDLLPSPVRVAAGGVAQLAAVGAPVALLALVLLRRWLRLALVLVATGVVAAAAATALQGWVDDSAPSQVVARLGHESWLTGAAFPSPAYLAAMAAMTTVLVPNLGPSWRRAAWWILAGAALLRVITAVAVPLHVGGTLLLGIIVGSATLLVTGAPARRSRLADVLEAAARGGHPLADLDPRPTDGLHGLQRARLADGTPVVVRIVDRDERDADLLYRVVTTAQRRGLGGGHPGWKPERRVQQEALATMLAGRAGVGVPEVVGVGALGDGIAVLVTDLRDDRSLAEVGADADADDTPDDLLAQVWDQVREMHDARIAHRQLRTDRIRLAGTATATPTATATTSDDGVEITDFSQAVLGADDTLLAADVAELLVSLALLVGPQRAVASARALGADRLTAALPLLQPLALSAATRRDLHADRSAGKALLEELRTTLQEATGGGKYELAELQRLSIGRIVSLVGGIFLVSVLISFASNWSSIAEALGDADLARVPVVVVLAAISYLAGALSLQGAVTRSLPLVQTTEVMLAQAFLNRFTPANAGGMALRARYLQRNGVDLDVAATSIGLTSAASGVMQAVFIVVFVAWSGSGQGDSTGFQLPDVNVLALVLCLLAAVAGLIWFTPLRRVLDSRLAVSARRVFGELRSLAASPAKITLLLGGAGLGKLVTIMAFAQSARAFGIDLGFAQLGALYLTANTVAAAAPTPGGVGALEAALVAVLTGAGVDATIALSTVLVFRLVTFWLPVPPSWLALRHLRSTDAV
jgi:undecaprenyl-diphosphatase